MEKHAIEDVENVPHSMGINSHRKPLSRTIEETGFAMGHFELEPGEPFSGGLHTHQDQEELFYITGRKPRSRSKTSRVTTRRPTRWGREVTHFEKGEQYQSGGNRDGQRVVAVALGVGRPRHRRADTTVRFDRAGYERPYTTSPQRTQLTTGCPIPRRWDSPARRAARSRRASLTRGRHLSATERPP